MGRPGRGRVGLLLSLSRCAELLGIAVVSMWLLWACYSCLKTKVYLFLVSRCVLGSLRGVLMMRAIAR